MKLYQVREIINTEYKKREYVLPGLPLGKVGILHSIGGVGKSFWALQACFQACASGSCDFEFNAISENAVSFGGKVAYLSFEDEAEDFGRRAKSFAEANAQDKSKSAWIRDISEVFDFAFLEQAIISKDNSEIAFTSEFKQLSDYFYELKKQRVSLLVFDTLSRVHLLDENSNQDMALLINWFERLARWLNCSILILHHDNKAGIGFTKDEAQNASSIRGASALASNVRWHASLRTMTVLEAENFNLEDERRSYLRIELDKTSYSPPSFKVGGARWQNGRCERCKRSYQINMRYL